MSGVLYEDTLRVFLLLTVTIGGGAAILAGRAIAAAWRPWWHILAFTLLIGLGVRFLHATLFGGTLLSVQFYVIDAVICVAFGLMGFRQMRVTQMVTCYGWINERTDGLHWRRKASAVQSTESG
jgi:hypothetical protein